GNGIVEAGEACDDGNLVNETQCEYGTPKCKACSSDCLTQIELTGPFCGDGNVDFGSGETCDDGPVVTECPYGLGHCVACSADCSTLGPLTGPVCGDGVINGPEVCDDGEAACGSCNPSCTVSQTPAVAAGFILAADGASLADGDTFTVADGEGTVAV